MVIDIAGDARKNPTNRAPLLLIEERITHFDNTVKRISYTNSD